MFTDSKAIHEFLWVPKPDLDPQLSRELTINSLRFTDVYNPNSQNVCGIFLILIKFDIFAIMTTKEKKVFFICSVIKYCL